MKVSAGLQYSSCQIRWIFHCPGYIKDDTITVESTVKVIKESRLSETKGSSEIIQVPPADIAEHLGKESFAAHKIVLAMRSPVFQAQLCGGMKEARMSRVTIEDVPPDVFGGPAAFCVHRFLA
uniref:BTB domain-containing protein n=1 Tax=Oryza glumipatula TaxID=40148 RepID=A0A0E0ASE2_9ORYZ